MAELEDWSTWDASQLRLYLRRVCKLPIDVVEGLVHDRTTAGGRWRIGREIEASRRAWRSQHPSVLVLRTDDLPLREGLGAGEDPDRG